MCQAAREAREHAAINTYASALKEQRECELGDTVPKILKQGHDIWRFSEQHAESKIVRMNMTGVDASKVMTRMDRVAALSEEISRALGHTKWGYSPLSFQFENAVLFFPECGRLFSNNEQRMRQLMPSLVRCHCNTFSARSQAEVYHMHHASSIGYENDQLEGVFAPEYHMSFHTALNPTNKTSAPFTVFDTHIPEVFNTRSIVYHLMSNPDVPHATRCEMQHANALLDDEMSVNFRELQDYVALVHFEHQACSRPDGGGNGSWWSLEAGEAM